MAIDFVQYFKNLNILYFAGTENQKLQIPSWVPDWSVNVPKNSFARAWRIRESLRGTGPSRDHRPLYEAAANNSATFQIDEGAITLVLRCTLIDQAKHIGCTFEGIDEALRRQVRESSEWHVWSRQWCENLRSCFELTRVHSRDRYSTNDEIQGTCSVCLVAGKFHNSHERADRVILADCWAKLSEFEDRMFRQDPANWTVETVAFVHMINAKTSNFAEFQRALASALTGHTFFISSSGYIGLGPSSIKSGDEICIIHGLPVPFVVRRVSGTQVLNNRGMLRSGCYGWRDF